jgi:uncharacterized membrane protein
MNFSTANPQRTGWIFLAGAVFACLLAVTTHSFWIDEVLIARVVQPATLTEAWRQLYAIHGSDLQMPLYIVWIWSAAKIFGTSELALRAVNALWFIPGVLAFALAFNGRAARTTVFLLAAGSPFLWYYLNEARAYSMEAGTSLLVFAVILHWWQNPETPVRTEWRRVLVLAAALVLLGGSSLLCLIFAATPPLAAAVLLPARRLRELALVFWPAGLAVLGMWLLIGLYYLWTLHDGARATNIAEMGWKNVVFIGYELFGFTGLGPGRLEIRDGGFGVFRAHAAELFLFGTTIFILTMLAGRDLWRRLGGKNFLLLALAVLLPAGFILAAGAVLHFRVLGRHFAALLPVVFLILATGALAGWRRGAAGKILVTVFFAGWLASALSVRLAARHEKDDYRNAAAIAKTALAAGRTVWWNAQAEGADYYHLPLADAGAGAPGARVLVNPVPDTLLAAGRPDVVIASRRDVYDAYGALAEFLAREHYRQRASLTGFNIWERNPAKLK